MLIYRRTSPASCPSQYPRRRNTPPPPVARVRWRRHADGCACVAESGCAFLASDGERQSTIKIPSRRAVARRSGAHHRSRHRPPTLSDFMTCRLRLHEQKVCASANTRLDRRTPIRGDKSTTGDDRALSKAARSAMCCSNAFAASAAGRRCHACGSRCECDAVNFERVHLDRCETRASSDSARTR